MDEYGVPTGDPPVDPDEVINGQMPDGIKTTLPLAVRCERPSCAVFIVISEIGTAGERCPPDKLGKELACLRFSECT